MEDREGVISVCARILIVLVGLLCVGFGIVYAVTGKSGPGAFLILYGLGIAVVGFCLLRQG